VTTQLEKTSATLAEERVARIAELDAGISRERDLGLAVTAADRKAATAAAEMEATRLQLADARTSVTELEETLKASAEAHDAEVQRLHAQVDSALQAVGRAWPKTVVAESPRGAA